MGTTNMMRGWNFGPIQWNGALGWIELKDPVGSFWNLIGMWEELGLRMY
jgi:hypothetical protein